MDRRSDSFLWEQIKKFLSYFLGSCITVCFLVSCNNGGTKNSILAQDSSGDPDNYSPSLTVGNTWFFRGVVTSNGTGTTNFLNTMTISGNRAVQGVMTSIRHESNPLNYGTAIDDYISKSRTGITYWGNSDANDFLTPHVVPYKELSFPLEIGTFEALNKTGQDSGVDLDGDGKNETFDIYTQVSMMGFQTRTVFVDTFHNVAQVETDSTITLHLSLDNSELLFSDTETDWYAPHVGLIKRDDVFIDYDGTIETTSEEIAGYSVEGQKKGITPQFTIASGVAIANSDTTTPGKMAIGFDGTNYLVVYYRNSGSSIGIYGAIIKGSGPGEIVVSFPIIQLSQGSLFPSPDVAFDGTNYLVVFQRYGQIYGTRVSPSGTVLDGPNGFVISTTGTSNWAPVVAFDGTNYLVAWEKFIGGYDIYGARITTGGQALGEFPIFQAQGEQVMPSIAFDGSNYMVVWRDTRSGSGPSDTTDIYGTRVTKAGTVLDPTGIPISTAPYAQGEPSIAFDGTDYFVVWVDGRNTLSSLNNGVYGTRLKTDGTLVDGPSTTGGIAISNASKNSSYASAYFDGTGYIVTWSVSNFSNDPNAGIYGARVSTNGNQGMGISISGPPPDYSRYVYPTILSNGANSLLLWVNNIELAGTSKDIYGMLIYH